MIGGRVLDVSAVEDIAQGRLYMQAVLESSFTESIVLAVPVTALISAWARVPHEQRKNVAAIAQYSMVVVDSVDSSSLTPIGEILARTGSTDIVSAHVIETALRRKWTILTRHTASLWQLDTRVQIDELP